jgi:hypothetical protein
LDQRKAARLAVIGLRQQSRGLRRGGNFFLDSGRLDVPGSRVDYFFDSENYSSNFDALAAPEREPVGRIVVRAAGFHVAHDEPQLVQVFCLRAFWDCWDKLLFKFAFRRGVRGHHNGLKFAVQKMHFVINAVEPTLGGIYVQDRLDQLLEARLHETVLVSLDYVRSSDFCEIIIFVTQECSRVSDD